MTKKNEVFSKSSSIISDQGGQVEMLFVGGKKITEVHFFMCIIYVHNIYDIYGVFENTSFF